ncbi:hypothetical protein S7711_09349 [Stachybotrys chartarum IBT 7711]|uniref:Uncharacterized protein n=1 Tax=Stachybotrys chartarum (strain CBS 109288 / IBT 7711) TaxID=1280523 RepID=A0A084AIU3_STACB|nr:hypothetical protein S7711_09349 [Stachybotrys chartarum IBT 7711]
MHFTTHYSYPWHQETDKSLTRRTDPSKERIVILGSGWAGYALARSLSPAKSTRVLVSPRSHFVFTPLLASSAVGTLEFRAVIEPVRRLGLAEFHQAWASRIDFARKRIVVEASAEDDGAAASSTGAAAAHGKGVEFEVAYDTLVVAVGAYSQTFGIEGVREHACFLRDVGDARAIRLRVLQAFEKASLPTTTDDGRRKLLHFAVVGGGPTGIEFAAELHDLVHDDLARLYPDLMRHVAITIYDIAPKVLPMFDQRLADYATAQFRRQGIVIKTEHHLTRIRREGDHLMLSIKEEEEEHGEVGAGICVWSTGLMQNPLVKQLTEQEVRVKDGEEEVVRLVKDAKTGGLGVDSHLRVQVQSRSGAVGSLPDVYAMGDCAVIQGAAGPALPATAQVASQQAVYLARQLNRRPHPTGSAPFRFRNWGTMAYLGSFRAIHQSDVDELTGRAAWILWRTAYLTKSMSVRNKLLVPVYCAEHAVTVARSLHAVTKPLGVPLLINDRVDVAVEVGCEGVHIGQDDMGMVVNAEYQQARELLGPDKIIGVSASSVAEALKACEAGADYLGLGAVYATTTKKDTKNILGPAGIRAILSALAAAGYASVPTVCIGGVNASNARAVLSASSASPAKSLDGVAVVSALVAAPDPAAAARRLLSEVLLAKVPDVIRAVARKTPLTHNITNLVVQNFAANIALAVGASPIMANDAGEAEDLARLGGALVINMGSVSRQQIDNYSAAVAAYNKIGRPVVLDPVGNQTAYTRAPDRRAGATTLRRQTVKTLLSSGHFDIIKGNEGEIQTVFGATVSQRGVDSASSLSLPQKLSLARAVARRQRSVVLLTGVTDVLSDGHRSLRVDNGHEYLGMVTGTGCTLGTVLSAMAAAWPGDVLLAAAAGTAMFGVAAEMAAERPEVRGPGTFVPAFIDALYAIRKATAEGDFRWTTLVKIQAVEADDEYTDTTNTKSRHTSADM